MRAIATVISSRHCVLRDDRVLSSTRYFGPARLGMATSILSSACLVVRATVGKSVLYMPPGEEDGRHGIPADGNVDTL